MEEQKEIVDNTLLAQDVASKIPYEMIKHFLVKPLDPVKVQKEFSKPVEKSQAQKDANNIAAIDYDEVTTEVKEVDADFRKGIVLKVPFDYTERLKDDKYAPIDIKVGDIVIFDSRSMIKYFDLCKDTMLIPAYDIVAIEQ